MPPLSRLVLLLASVAGWDELSDNSTCARGGLTDAMLESYRSRVTLRNQYGATTNVSGVFLPVFSSLPLDETSAAHAAVQSAVVFIHGFSATGHEIRPLPDLVANGLVANLFFTRLSGHGQGGPAMGCATLDDWRADVAQALAFGRMLGKRVLVS